jgi:phage/plasmid-associated DNA primase
MSARLSYRTRKRRNWLSQARVPDTVTMPSWLGDERPAMFSFQNGLVSRDAALSGLEATLQPHSLEWFNDVVFPFDFNHAADCPQWLMFLLHILDGDAERIALMQEMFGYVLVPGNWMHKFFLLEGQGANGKSVVLKTLEALLGRENTSSVPLGLFGERSRMGFSHPTAFIVSSQSGTQLGGVQPRMKLTDMDVRFPMANTAPRTSNALLPSRRERKRLLGT